jgi:hypothetical protein
MRVHQPFAVPRQPRSRFKSTSSAGARCTSRSATRFACSLPEANCEPGITFPARGNSPINSASQETLCSSPSAAWPAKATSKLPRAHIPSSVTAMQIFFRREGLRDNQSLHRALSAARRSRSGAKRSSLCIPGENQSLISSSAGRARTASRGAPGAGSCSTALHPPAPLFPSIRIRRACLNCAMRSRTTLAPRAE